MFSQNHEIKLVWFATSGHNLAAKQEETHQKSRAWLFLSWRRKQNKMLHWAKLKHFSLLFRSIFMHRDTADCNKCTFNKKVWKLTMRSETWERPNTAPIFRNKLNSWEPFNVCSSDEQVLNADQVDETGIDDCLSEHSICQVLHLRLKAGDSSPQSVCHVEIKHLRC